MKTITKHYITVIITIYILLIIYALSAINIITASLQLVLTILILIIQNYTHRYLNNPNTPIRILILVPIYTKYIFILDTLGIKRKINNKIYRKHIFHSLIGLDLVDRNYHTSITDITTYKKKNHITVYITCHRLGILIGKAGSTFNRIRQHLREFIQEDNPNLTLDLIIKENKIWSNLYN